MNGTRRMIIEVPAELFEEYDKYVPRGFRGKIVSVLIEGMLKLYREGDRYSVTMGIMTRDVPMLEVLAKAKEAKDAEEAKKEIAEKQNTPKENAPKQPVPKQPTTSPSPRMVTNYNPDDLDSNTMEVHP